MGAEAKEKVTEAKESSQSCVTRECGRGFRWWEGSQIFTGETSQSGVEEERREKRREWRERRCVRSSVSRSGSSVRVTAVMV